MWTVRHTASLLLLPHNVSLGCDEACPVMVRINIEAVEACPIGDHYHRRRGLPPATESTHCWTVMFAPATGLPPSSVAMPVT